MEKEVNKVKAVVCGQKVQFLSSCNGFPLGSIKIDENSTIEKQVNELATERNWIVEGILL